MGNYHITYGPAKITVDNVDDLMAFLQRLPKATGRPPFLPTQISSPIYSGDDTLARLWRDEIRDELQRALLFALADAPEGLTDVELRAALRLADNKQLAAAVTALVKNAKRCGLGRVDVIWSVRADGPDGARYHYQIAPMLRSVIRSQKERRPNEKRSRSRARK